MTTDDQTTSGTPAKTFLIVAPPIVVAACYSMSVAELAILAERAGVERISR